MSTDSPEITNCKVHPAVAREIAAWTASIFGSSDRPSKILRLHALTESYLDRLLGAYLVKADVVIEDARFGYHHKKALVNGMRLLPPNVIESLSRLNALRNKCAHSAFPGVSDDDVRHAAAPIQNAVDVTVKDYETDGVKTDFVNIYAWAIFSEVTLRIPPTDEDLKVIS